MSIFSKAKDMLTLQQKFVEEAEAIKRTNEDLALVSLDKQVTLEDKLKVERTQEKLFKSEAAQVIFIDNVKGLFTKKEDKV
mgnify:CR=1 FL=1|tara:strand:- start:1894 stop:2136 length:243 start_codon:yes stop_codon:yes gene_type:complete